jgi:hypothetical protein
MTHTHLDVGDLVVGELVLVHCDARRPEVLEEAELLGEEEEERLAAPSRAARRAAHAVDVLLRVIGRVVLDDPVDVGDVEAAGRDVGAEEDAALGLAEVEKGHGALRLLLLAVDVRDGDVDVVEELAVVLDAVAAGEEDHDLLVLEVLLEEGVEQQEALLGRAHDVPLLEGLHRRADVVVADADVLGRAGDGELGEVLDLLGLRRGEEGRLALLGQVADDCVHLLLEALLEEAVRLVDDERRKVGDDEALGVLEVVEEAPRGRDEDVDALLELLGLGAAVGAAHDEAKGLAVVRHQVRELPVDLQGELAGRGDDDRAEPVARLELHLGEELDGGHEEGEGLSAARLGRPEDVLAAEEVRDGLRLDLGHPAEAHVREGALRLGREGQRAEGRVGEEGARVRRHGLSDAGRVRVRGGGRLAQARGVRRGILGPLGRRGSGHGGGGGGRGRGGRGLVVLLLPVKLLVVVLLLVVILVVLVVVLVLVVVVVVVVVVILVVVPNGLAGPGVLPALAEDDLVLLVVLVLALVGRLAGVGCSRGRGGRGLLLLLRERVLLAGVLEALYRGRELPRALDHDRLGVGRRGGRGARLGLGRRRDGRRRGRRGLGGCGRGGGRGRLGQCLRLGLRLRLDLPAVDDARGAGGLSAARADALEGPDDVLAAQDLAEDDVLAVEVRRGVEGDEELRPVGVLAGVCHGEEQGPVVAELEVLVGEGAPVDALAARPVALGEVAALRHEAGDDAVEGAAPEGQGLAELAAAPLPRAECPEVLRGARNNVGEELEGHALRLVGADGDVEEDDRPPGRGGGPRAGAGASTERRAAVHLFVRVPVLGNPRGEGERDARGTGRRERAARAEERLGLGLRSARDVEKALGGGGRAWGGEERCEGRINRNRA